MPPVGRTIQVAPLENRRRVFGLAPFSSAWRRSPSRSHSAARILVPPGRDYVDEVRPTGSRSRSSASYVRQRTVRRLSWGVAFFDANRKIDVNGEAIRRSQ